MPLQADSRLKKVGLVQYLLVMTTINKCPRLIFDNRNNDDDDDDDDDNNNNNTIDDSNNNLPGKFSYHD